jgi:RNA polymerase sigma-70 factor, ECF subfamily
MSAALKPEFCCVSTLLMSADGEPRDVAAAATPRAAPGAQRQAMERFLAEVEKRAYQLAWLALRHEDDALDAVQDAMLQLCRSYADRPAAEWRPLFFRILVNKVQDQRRRRSVRGRWLAWWPQRQHEDDDASDPIDTTPDTRQEPLRQLAGENALRLVAGAVQALPPRQQEAFLLRNVEGLDIAGTALAMGCSEGSVKTHYFRALQALRAAVGEELP